MYRPRRPLASPLYRLLSDYFVRFLGRYEDEFERRHGRWRRVVDAVVGRFSYITRSAPAGGGISTSTLRVMDANDAPATSPVGMAEFPAQIKDLAVAGEYVYAAGTDRLSVIDVSDPERPTVVTQSAEFRSVYPLTVAAQCLYSGRGVLDISEPEAPTEIARWPHVVTAVGVAGKYVYVAHGNQLSIFDAVQCGVPLRRVYLPFADRGD